MRIVHCPMLSEKLEKSARSTELMQLDHSVDVWLFNCEDYGECIVDFTKQLSTNEMQLANGYSSQNDRRNFIIRRALLRSMLGSYLSSDPKEIEYRSGPFGKPYLGLGYPAGHLEFSVSKTGSLVVIAVSRHAVGIDIEYMAPFPEDESVIGMCFSPIELREMKLADPSCRWLDFYHVWTCKEALSKALGYGLSLDLRSVSIPWDARNHDQRKPALAYLWNTASFLVHSQVPVPMYSLGICVSDKIQFQRLILV